MEFTITGANAMTYPSLHIWDWRVAIYLFLGGLAGGMMSMSAIANLRPGKVLPRDQPCCWRIPFLAPILLSVGMLFLFLDLELKSHIFWFYRTFEVSSPMSWGSWILVLIYPPMLLYALAAVPDDIKERMQPGLTKRWADRMRPHLLLLARVNFVAGILLTIYTGILLSTFVARPLWNSAILPVLFLISGMSTGAAFLIIMAHKKEVKLFFTKVDIWLIFGEIAVLLLFFYGQYVSDAAHRAAIMPFFNT
ncbi:MAG: polysulfide reductase NrfD [Deltaproteobacteria bacterium]